jgi:hypothetical protein
MTVKQIETKMKQEQIVYETAMKIRTLLDEARKAYGSTEWDENDCENRAMELVTES